MTQQVRLYRKVGSPGTYKPLDACALVDDGDHDLIMSITEHWLLHSEGYAYTNIQSKARLMHRIILGLTDPKVHTDHKDHDRLNNQRSNIKACSQFENNQNLPFYGVSRSRHRWRAFTPTPTRHIGVFATKEEAEQAVEQWFSDNNRSR